MPFVTTLTTMNPLPPLVNIKRKKRVMNVFFFFLPKICLDNTYFFVFLCIIEIERTLIHKKHLFYLVIYSDVSQKNCFFSPPKF